MGRSYDAEYEQSEPETCASQRRDSKQVHVFYISELIFIARSFSRYVQQAITLNRSSAFASQAAYPAFTPITQIRPPALLSSPVQPNSRVNLQKSKRSARSFISS